MGRHRQPRADYRAEAAWMLRLVAAVRADKQAPAAFSATVVEQADKIARLLLDETRRREALAKAVPKTGARRPRPETETAEDDTSHDAPAPARAVG